MSIQTHEKREAMLQELLINPTQTQFYALPLFQDIDLTSETLNLIKRAKYVCNWSDQTYNWVISTYFDENKETLFKYNIIKQTVNEGIKLCSTEDYLKKIQQIEIIKDTLLLYIKAVLSRGIIWQGLEQARRVYNYDILPKREKLLTQYRNNNIHKLMVKEVEKHTPICDDIRKYIIAQYIDI